jgi:hypothetical protein
MTRPITPAEDMALDAAEHARRPAPDVARANAETTARSVARMRECQTCSSPNECLGWGYCIDDYDNQTKQETK